MSLKGFCYKGKTILKCGRQNGRQKQGFLSKNLIFERINPSNIQKNRAFMHCFRITTRFWCGRKERSDGIARNERPGIEDIRRYEKALVFKAFLR